MEWQKVESTQVAEVGFEEPDTLGMKFKQKDGGVSEYHFQNVPARMHRAMMSAKSVGIYFAENIKNKKGPDEKLLYPFEKVQAENPSLSFSIETSTKSTNTEGTKPTESMDGEKAESTGSALATVDKLEAKDIFVPGTLDPLLARIRDEVLARAKSLDISTPKNRKAIKDLKNKVVKSRTFIESLRVGYVSGEKKRLKTVDEEAGRIKDILLCLQDEVGTVTGLTAWEGKEEARVQKHTDALKQIEEMKPHVYLSIEALTTAIALLEEMDTETFEEFSVPAEKAKEQVLAELKADLTKRETAERDQAELEKLRAEANARAEADRVAAIEREAKEKAERALDAERERIQRESLAAEQRAKDAEAKAAADKVESERKATEAAAQAVRDQDAAVEAERKRIADEAERERKATEARAADAKHRAIFNNEARAELFKVTLLDDAFLDALIEAIAAGRIPHIKIEY